MRSKVEKRPYGLPPDTWRRLRSDGPDVLSVPTWLLRLHKELGQAASRTLLSLWCWLWLWDSCDATTRELAGVIGVSCDTVERGLRELQRTGYLTGEVKAGRTIWHATIKLLELKCPRMREAFLGPDLTPGPKHASVPWGLLSKPPDLTGTQWWVLLGLYAFWQRHDWCCPSQRSLADCLGLSLPAVRCALSVLKSKGYVEVQARYNSSNVYHKTVRLSEREALPVGSRPPDPRYAEVADELFKWMWREVEECLDG